MWLLSGGNCLLDAILVFERPSDLQIMEQRRHNELQIILSMQHITWKNVFLFVQFLAIYEIFINKTRC
jgi:hypothetical protein